MEIKAVHTFNKENDRGLFRAPDSTPQIEHVTILEFVGDFNGYGIMAVYKTADGVLGGDGISQFKVIQ
jgi:hypothetical protein